MRDTAGRDWRPLAVAALGEAVADLEGPLRDLMDEAIAHLDGLLAGQAPETVAAVAVPAAVFGSLSAGTPPPGLLASAAATYLALDVLDDQMDGEPPAFWQARRPGEAVLGAQMLLQTAAITLSHGAAPETGAELRRLYRAMLARVVEGQLRTEEPVAPSTTPAEVHATIGARSGTMLAGFAAMAAVAAEGGQPDVQAARAFGHELGLARQHLNDLTELVGDRTTDLRNGTATMAVALALQSRSPPGRGVLIDQLRSAAGDPQTRRRLVTQDLASSIADVCVLIQLHLGEARRQAAFLSPPHLGHDDLDRLVQFTADTVRRNHVR